MATETAMPTTTSNIATLQQYRDRYRPFQPDIIDDAIGGGALAPTTNGTTTVSLANGGAVVQGCRYDLTSGPMVFTPAANGGGSNRFDIVCLTFDASHTPVVYSRIVQGTVGAGLPALTNSLTGVWDFPIAHFEKTPAGTIVNLRDRRKFSDGLGETLGSDDTNGTNNAGWFPPSPKVGQCQRFWPSRAIWQWNGTIWEYIGGEKIRFKSKATDQTYTAQTTPQNDTDLIITDLTPFGVYDIECFLSCIGTDASNIKIGWNTFPTGATAAWTPDAINTTPNNDNGPIRRPFATSNSARSIGATAGANGGPIVATPKLKLIMGSSTGTLQVQHAQVTSGATATGLGAGSWITAERVA